MLCSLISLLSQTVCIIELSLKNLTSNLGIYLDLEPLRIYGPCQTSVLLEEYWNCSQLNYSLFSKIILNRSYVFFLNIDIVTRLCCSYHSIKTLNQHCQCESTLSYSANVSPALPIALIHLWWLVTSGLYARLHYGCTVKWARSKKKWAWF